MDCPTDSRCFACTHRDGRTCNAVPAPMAALILRDGARVTVCRSYQGPDGERPAFEGAVGGAGAQKPRVRIG